MGYRPADWLQKLQNYISDRVNQVDAARLHVYSHAIVNRAIAFVMVSMAVDKLAVWMSMDSLEMLHINYIYNLFLELITKYM